MGEGASKSEIDVKPIDEGALTKGQLRKLNALRKSVGPDIGERAFTEWLASQAKAEKADKNIETIVDALWPLVQQGKLSIRRGGYLVRRGRGRLLVEPVEPTPAVRPMSRTVGSADTTLAGYEETEQSEPSGQDRDRGTT